MDAEMLTRIRAAHIPTIAWWGCAVQLTCRTCQAAYPCLAVVALEERLRHERVRGDVGWLR
jgi:hypothetical protein